MSRLITVALVALAALPPLPRSLAAQRVADATVAESVAELHRLINRQRMAAGCDPVGWHEPTARVAEAHSRDMAERDYFDHVSPDGTDLTVRLLAGGVTWHGRVAENIALTTAGAPSAIELWMDSPPHRANIRECSFTHQGIGLYLYRWTQVLVERPAAIE
jgi:uncharacterized protein YkwD